MNITYLNFLPEKGFPFFIYYLNPEGKYYGWDSVNERFYNFSNPNLNDVEGISFDNLQEGDVLSYDSDSQTWINKVNSTSTGVNSFNERQGDVYLLGSDVTYALEYTPEDLANKVTAIIPEEISEVSYPSTSAVYNYIASVLPQKYYGAFQDDTSQYATDNNVGYGVIFGINDISGQGVEITLDPFDNKTLIYIENSGTYNIQFSLQFQNSADVINFVTVWLRKNEEDSPGTARTIPVLNSFKETPCPNIMAYNYFVEANAGDFYQLVWSTTDYDRVNMGLSTTEKNIPSFASAILTVNQVN